MATLTRSLNSPVSVDAVRRVTQLLRPEGAAVLAAAAVFYAGLDASWWLFAGLFLVPDLTMAGYAFGPRFGAVTYNAAHTYTAAIALGLAGLVWFAPLLPCAAVWVAHIGFDRMMGYGLKYSTGFGDTDLGSSSRS